MSISHTRTHWLAVLLLVASASQAANTPRLVAGGSSSLPRVWDQTLGSDGAGGFYVSWNQQVSSTISTFVQRFDDNSQPLWTPGGVPALTNNVGDIAVYPLFDGTKGVPTVLDNFGTDFGCEYLTTTGAQESMTCGLSVDNSVVFLADHNSGVIAAIVHNRSTPPTIGCDVPGCETLVRIDTSGTVWQLNSQQLEPPASTDTSFLVQAADVASDGSLVAVCKGNNDGFWVVRHDPSGNVSWRQPLASDASTQISNVLVGSDGSVYVLADEADTTNPSAVTIAQWTLYHLASNDGSETWATPPSMTINLTDSNIGLVPQLTPSGVIVTWAVADASTGLEDLVAQKVGSDGQLSWGAGGVKVATNIQTRVSETFGVFPYAITTDGAGGAIFTWEAQDGSFNLYAQHVAADGNMDWGGNIATATDNNADPLLATDDNGGAFALWHTTNSGVDSLFALDVTAPSGSTGGSGGNGNGGGSSAGGTSSSYSSGGGGMGFLSLVVLIVVLVSKGFRHAHKHDC